MKMLPIYLTGIRRGETIISTNGSLQNKGSKIVIIGIENGDNKRMIYPPSKWGLDSLSNEEWDRLLIVLSKTRCYEGMGIDIIKKDLLSEATDHKDLYLDDIPELLVRPVTLDGNLFVSKLGKDSINKFVTSNASRSDGLWFLNDIYQAIRPKNGFKSRARHHTLVFRPSIWTLDLSEQFNEIRVDSAHIFSRPHWNMHADDIVENSPRKGFIYTMPKDFPVDILLNNPVDSNKLSILDLIRTINKITNVPIDQLENIETELTGYAPSMHKSLIQKIIRTGSLFVEHDATNYPSDCILLMSFALLLVHPGSFVPDLNRFVSGAESACKRLAVSIAEDSYTKEYGQITSLLFAAYLTRFNWNPSIDLVEKWMILAMNARKCTKMFKYSTKEQRNVALELNKFSLAYSALDLLRSFDTDITMMYSIAKNNGVYWQRECESVKELAHSIPLVHFLDHHTRTDILYYGYWSGVSSISDLFVMIWNKSSGINPRNPKYESFWVDALSGSSSDDVVNEIKNAQHLLYKALRLGPHESTSLCLNNIADEYITMTYLLPDQWIVGMVGPVSVTVGRKQLLVTINPKDIQGRVAIAKPKRGAKQIAELSDNEKIAAINKFNQLLEAGIKIKHTPFEEYKNAVAYFNTKSNEFELSINGNIVNWESARRITRKYIPLSKYNTVEAETSLTSSYVITTVINNKNLCAHCLGIAPPELINSLKNVDKRILSRLLTILRGTKSVIRMPKISKDGTGVKYTVSMLDSDVWKLLCWISAMYPAAAQLRSSDSWMVTDLMFVGKIIDMLESYLGSLATYDEWPSFAKVDRNLRDYQDELIRYISDNEEIHGHILDVTVGLGKTAIVAESVRSLSEKNRMVNYLIFSTPTSALDSIIKEFEYYGFDVNVLDARKTRKKSTNSTFKPFVVNIIRHDHMRHPTIIDKLRRIAPCAFIIIDEFHHTLDPTQRTSIALDIARLSWKFIAMSGTPIKDNKTEYLIKWLELVVDFEVNEHNFWTAVAGGMMSRRAKLDIVVRHYKEEAIIEQDDQLIYDSLFHDNGRALSSECFRKAINISRNAVVPRMIELTTEYVLSGRYVLLVAGNQTQQLTFRDLLIKSGINSDEIVLITGDNPITLTDESTGCYKVAITTVKHHTGYTLTRMSVLITSVYFTNETVREQLIGRINRLTQRRPEVDIVTVHAGILTNILKRYEEARSMSEALKSYSKLIGINMKEMKNLL